MADRTIDPEDGAGELGEEHPSAETLVAYYEDRLDPAAKAAVESHLGSCDECGRGIGAIVSLGASNWSRFLDRWGDDFFGVGWREREDKAEPPPD